MVVVVTGPASLPGSGVTVSWLVLERVWACQVKTETVPSGAPSGRDRVLLNAPSTIRPGVTQSTARNCSVSSRSETSGSTSPSAMPT